MGNDAAENPIPKGISKSTHDRRSAQAEIQISARIPRHTHAGGNAQAKIQIANVQGGQGRFVFSGPKELFSFSAAGTKTVSSFQTSVDFAQNATQAAAATTERQGQPKPFETHRLLRH